MGCVRVQIINETKREFAYILIDLVETCKANFLAYQKRRTDTNRAGTRREIALLSDIKT
jgi:hypothetical protein